MPPLPQAGPMNPASQLPNPFAVSQPGPPTQEQLLADHARQILATQAQAFAVLSQSTVAVWQAIWLHPAFTPQQVLDALDAVLPGSALKTFIAGAASIQAVETTHPGTIPAQCMSARQTYQLNPETPEHSVTTPAPAPAV